MTLQLFILRLFPVYTELEKEVIALRGDLALSEARLDMANQRLESTGAPVTRKAPVIRTKSWKEFQERVADLQEKEK